MQSSYETYSQWEKRTFCDNAARRGRGISVNPQCYDGKREYECTVFYDEYRSTSNSDTMTLCSECRDNLKKSARRHGYGFQSRRLVNEHGHSKQNDGF